MQSIIVVLGFMQFSLNIALGGMFKLGGKNRKKGIPPLEMEKRKMNNKVKEGAKIIVEKWLDIKKDESVIIITDESHFEEVLEIKHQSEERGAFVVITVVPMNSPQSGEYFDSIASVFMHADVIVGASNYSLITTEAVKTALQNGSRFLSLPLSTSDGKSLLEYELVKMDTETAEIMAENLISYINKSENLRVTTGKGTDITFRKKGRNASYFNGKADKKGGFGSISFEVYVAIEEDRTNGELLLDASMGYIGKINNPVKLEFEEGKITYIEKNEDGLKLDNYIKSFDDENMYYACEFGIGLNELSGCNGNSYIEDESTFGTFHIGLGRNIALGGALYANGHFDIVVNEPNIYADSVLIMEKGKIIV